MLVFQQIIISSIVKSMHCAPYQANVLFCCFLKLSIKSASPRDLTIVIWIVSRLHIAF